MFSKKQCSICGGDIGLLGNRKLEDGNCCKVATAPVPKTQIGSVHTFTELSLNGEPVRDDRLYTVGLEKFHFLNLEENLAVSLEEVSANGRPRVVATSCTTIMDEYLSEHQLLDARIEGRITVL